MLSRPCQEQFRGISCAARYFSAPKPQIQKDLQEAEEQCLKQVAELTKTREKIAKDVHTVEAEIRELLQSDPVLGKRFLNQ
jgi:chaperonin cofactor prefoldin